MLGLLALLLWVLQALTSWREFNDAAHVARLSPRQRRDASLRAIVTSLLWPVFAVAALLMANATSLREWR